MNYVHHNKVDLQSSNKSGLLLFFYNFFFSSMKKCLKINLLNIIKTIKEEKNLLKDTKVFLKNNNKKRHNMVMNDTKVYQKMKNKSWLL